MPTHWTTVAKTQLRILTSRVRRFRVGFFIVVTAILFIWAFYGAPAIVSSLVPNIQSLGSLLLPYIGSYVDFIFIMVFAFFIIYQLSAAFQAKGEGQHEMLLATPIKEGDIFLGEYLGKMPVYLWGILFLVPLIVSLLQSVFIISALDIVIITFIVFGLVAVASWIGAILTGYAIKKLSRSVRGKDIGRALAILLALVFMAAYYGLLYLGQGAISNPNLRAWLQISPSSWFANLLNAIIGAPLPLSWLGWELSFIFVVIFSFVLFFGGYRLAPHFYSLDIASTQMTYSIVNENIYFRFLRWLLPRAWKGVVITQLKNFLRRKENIAKLAYLIIIVILFLFIGDYGFNSNSSGSFGTSGNDFAIIFFPWLLDLFVGIQLGTFIFVNSKDMIWIFKQSPRNIKTLVLGNWFAMIMLLFPLVAGLCIFVAITTNMDVIQGILFFGIILLGCVSTLAMAMGLGSINPAFQQRSGKMTVNMLIFLGIQFCIFFLIFFAMSNVLFTINIAPSIFVLFEIPFVIALVNCSAGLSILVLGIWKLEEIE